MFENAFPPSIVPAIVILAVVARRLWDFYLHREYLQLGQAAPELILGVIYLIDAFCPFADNHRVLLVRNSIIILFLVKFIYQSYAIPKMRRLATDGLK